MQQRPYFSHERLASIESWNRGAGSTLIATTIRLRDLATASHYVHLRYFRSRSKRYGERRVIYELESNFSRVSRLDLTIIRRRRNKHSGKATLCLY